MKTFVFVLCTSFHENAANSQISEKELRICENFPVSARVRRQISDYQCQTVHHHHPIAEPTNPWLEFQVRRYESGTIRTSNLVYLPDLWSRPRSDWINATKLVAAQPHQTRIEVWIPLDNRRNWPMELKVQPSSWADSRWRKRAKRKICIQWERRKIERTSDSTYCVNT